MRPSVASAQPQSSLVCSKPSKIPRPTFKANVQRRRRSQALAALPAIPASGAAVCYRPQQSCRRSSRAGAKPVNSAGIVRNQRSPNAAPKSKTASTTALITRAQDKNHQAQQRSVAAVNRHLARQSTFRGKVDGPRVVAAPKIVPQLARPVKSNLKKSPIPKLTVTPPGDADAAGRARRVRFNVSKGDRSSLAQQSSTNSGNKTAVEMQRDDDFAADPRSLQSIQTNTGIAGYIDSMKKSPGFVSGSVNRFVDANSRPSIIERRFMIQSPSNLQRPSVQDTFSKFVGSVVRESMRADGIGSSTKAATPSSSKERPSGLFDRFAKQPSTNVFTAALASSAVKAKLKQSNVVPAPASDKQAEDSFFLVPLPVAPKCCPASANSTANDSVAFPPDQTLDRSMALRNASDAALQAELEDIEQRKLVVLKALERKAADNANMLSDSDSVTSLRINKKLDFAGISPDSSVATVDVTGTDQSSIADESYMMKSHHDESFDVTVVAASSQKLLPTRSRVVFVGGGDSPISPLASRGNVWAAKIATPKPKRSSAAVVTEGKENDVASERADANNTEQLVDIPEPPIKTPLLMRSATKLRSGVVLSSPGSSANRTCSSPLSICFSPSSPSSSPTPSFLKSVKRDIDRASKIFSSTLIDSPRLSSPVSINTNNIDADDVYRWSDSSAFALFPYDTMQGITSEKELSTSFMQLDLSSLSATPLPRKSSNLLHAAASAIPEPRLSPISGKSKPFKALVVKSTADGEQRQYIGKQKLMAMCIESDDFAESVAKSDLICDLEVSRAFEKTMGVSPRIFAQRSPSRLFNNPLAQIFKDGDDMFVIPISSPSTGESASED